MKVQASQIALAGEHSASFVYRLRESLRATRVVDGRETGVELQRHVDFTTSTVDTYQQLAQHRDARVKPLRAPMLQPLDLAPMPVAPRPLARIPPPASSPHATHPTDSLPLDSEILLLQLLIEWLSGREVRVARIELPPGGSGPEAAGTAPVEVAAPPTFSIEYTASEYSREDEATRFTATATVETADGRQIRVDLSLLMQRSFETASVTTLRAGTRKDPLLINLADNGAELSRVRYRFDLDGDGTGEEIAFATGASAFVAIDYDQDGRITGGGELFGARSGDGFAELARHDTDRSGFIDEADPVFAQLLAYRKDATGTDQITPLASLGVGAIYLGNTATPFELRAPGNEALGAVRSTGLFLREDGSAGTLQQVDLVV